MAIISGTETPGCLKRGCQILESEGVVRALTRIPIVFNLEVKFVKEEYVTTRTRKGLKDIG